MKKTIFFALALLVMLTIAFAGCSDAANDSATQAPDATKTSSVTQTPAATDPPVDSGLNPIINMDSLTPVTTEVVTPSVIMRWRGDQSTPEEMFIFEYFEKACNIKFDVTPIENSAFAEKINVVLNSGDMPDLIAGGGFSADVMVRYFEDGGLGLDMNPLIELYAPDIVKYFESEPDQKQMCEVNGKLLSMPIYRYVSFDGTRSWIRQDWLDAVDRDMPTNLQEFKETLIAFRDGDPNGNGEADDIAVGGSWDEGYNERDFFLSSFGSTKAVGEYLRVDYSSGEPVVQYLPIHESFREYLTYMNDLWEEGLLDPDLFTQAETASLAKIAGNTVGFAVGGAPYVLLPDDKQAKRQDYIYQFCGALSKDADTEPVVALGLPCQVGFHVISADSEYGDVLVRLANLAFNWETMTVFCYGPSYGGPQDINENHKAAYRQDPDNPVAYDYPHRIENYPDLTSWQYLLNYVTSWQWQIGPSTGSKFYMPDYMSEKTSVNEDNEIYKVGVENAVDPTENVDSWNYMMIMAGVNYGVPGFPILYLSVEDNNRALELATALDDMVAQMEAKIITGAEPLSAIDTMIDDLKSQGAEEYEQIYQKYYAEYMEKNN